MAETVNRKRVIAVWILRVILGLAFLTIGIAKLTGTLHTVQTFEAFGWGQWLRYVTGLLDIIGALLVLAPKWGFYRSPRVGMHCRVCSDPLLEASSRFARSADAHILGRHRCLANTSNCRCQPAEVMPRVRGKRVTAKVRTSAGVGPGLRSSCFSVLISSSRREHCQRHQGVD